MRLSIIQVVDNEFMVSSIHRSLPYNITAIALVAVQLICHLTIELLFSGCWRYQFTSQTIANQQILHLFPLIEENRWKTIVPNKNRKPTSFANSVASNTTHLTAVTCAPQFPAASPADLCRSPGEVARPGVAVPGLAMVVAMVSSHFWWWRMGEMMLKWWFWWWEIVEVLWFWWVLLMYIFRCLRMETMRLAHSCFMRKLQWWLWWCLMIKHPKHLRVCDPFLRKRKPNKNKQPTNRINNLWLLTNKVYQ